MAPSSVLTYRVEIEFVTGSGVYIDVSMRVTDVTINRPAGTRLGEASPTTLEVSFLNHPATAAEVAAWGTPAGIAFCPLSPESPAAAFYPNVTRDKLVKVTALWNGGASTSLRFWGWVDTWTPEAGSLPPGTATVTMTASCVLSRYARRNLLSTYGERNLFHPEYDYWPLNEAPDSTTLKGYATEGKPVNDATVVLPYLRPGKAELQPAEGGHATDGQIAFSRSDMFNFPAPIVQVKARTNGEVPSSFEAWIKLDTDTSGGNDDAVVAYTRTGRIIWRWSAMLIGGVIKWQLFNDVGTVMVTYDTQAQRDGNWHFFFLWFPDTTTVNIAISNRGNRYASAVSTGAAFTYDPRGFHYLSIGGNMSPTLPGKITSTLQGAVSSFRLAYSGDVVSGQGYNDPGTSITAATYRVVTTNANLDVDAFVGGGVSTPGDIRPILSSNKYPNMLDRWNELARSTLSEMRTRTDGRREFRSLGDTRPTAVSLTLDAEQDLSAPDGGWQPVKDEAPTRVLVTGPPGSVTYVRTAVETASGVRLDGGSIDVTCGSISDMRTVAAFATIQTGTRLRSFGFDPTITSGDQIAAAMALQPRERVRITSIPVALTGQSYLDVFAYGWTERFNPDTGACGWTFETWLADDPAEGVFDDAEYGRIAVGDGVGYGSGGTTIGNTAAGTLIVTSSTPLTTNAASYPLDLDYAGERVTVASAPASAVSPQTLTISARGVAPTVARIHAVNDPVDIWHAMRFGV